MGEHFSKVITLLNPFNSAFRRERETERESARELKRGEREEREIAPGDGNAPQTCGRCERCRGTASVRGMDAGDDQRGHIKERSGLRRLFKRDGWVAASGGGRVGVWGLGQGHWQRDLVISGLMWSTMESSHKSTMSRSDLWLSRIVWGVGVGVGGGGCVCAVHFRHTGETFTLVYSTRESSLEK